MKTSFYRLTIFRIKPDLGRTYVIFDQPLEISNAAASEYFHNYPPWPVTIACFNNHATGIHSIMQTVVETPPYLTPPAALFTESERSDMVAAIASDPEAGDLMPGTGGYRKRQFGRAGMGKRRGARVVSLYGSEDFLIKLTRRRRIRLGQGSYLYGATK